MLCACGDSILAAARSRSRENNTQLFSNALAPLRYPCLLGKRFSRRNTPSDFRRKYQTLTELKRGWKPRRILLASVTFFKVALCASLPSAKARGAICVSVLASKLADTLSLDYQRSSHPTQYPTKFLDIALDISPRLAILDSHIPTNFSTKRSVNSLISCVYLPCLNKKLLLLTFLFQYGKIILPYW